MLNPSHPNWRSALQAFCIAVALLATHLIDASVGQALFGEPLRMHRDLLADAAAQRIRELLP